MVIDIFKYIRLYGSYLKFQTKNTLTIHTYGWREDVTPYGYLWFITRVQFSSLSRVRLSMTPWITARQASLSITNSWSSLRLTSIESVMPSSHLILCHPLLLLPTIRVFSNESTLRMRWPKYWSYSFMMYSAYKLNKQGDNIQPWHTPFPIWNQSVVYVQF